ncbi:hypothetical protein MKZ38_000120 [Zalerion maritima]|uniref:FAD dependent oxidoreductase domain-containing protein n=1 Tax=Zalerion maritima TaxID=339359 RepID=A0AAD5RT06_9PEZI|nr:hypothetical protein MKZ38_000120 [Zalerion maritima]
MPTTVILGGGIIGLSTAYYLAKLSPPSPRDKTPRVVLVDPSPDLFRGASSNAGGFLARDWFRDEVVGLGAMSFDMHRALAEENGKQGRRWGYTGGRGWCYTAAVQDEGGSKNRGIDWLFEGVSRAVAIADGASTEMKEEGKRLGGVSWVKRRQDEEGNGRDELALAADKRSIAQIDPGKFCEFLLEKVREMGVEVRVPGVAKGVTTSGGKVTGLWVESLGATELIGLDNMVVSAGVWTPKVFETLFPKGKGVDVGCLSGHSIVLDAEELDITTPTVRTASGNFKDENDAIFMVLEDGMSPEMFDRNHGTEVWLGGVNHNVQEAPIPQLPGKAETMKWAVDKLKDVAERMLKFKRNDGQRKELKVVRASLCFRPWMDRGWPVLGRVGGDVLGISGHDEKRNGNREGGGVFVATGHGPWGISMAPGTGLVMAEMVLGMKTSIDVSRLALGAEREERGLKSKL